MKDLESKLSQYSSKLVEITQGTSSFKTSPILRSLDELGYNIKRVDVSQVSGRGEGDPIQRIKKSTGRIVDKIYEEYIKLFGELPWMIDVGCSPPRIELGNDSNTLSVDKSPLVATEDITAEENLAKTSKLTINEKLNSLNPDVRQRIVYSATEVFENYLPSLMLFSYRIILWKMFSPMLLKR
jgi:hypothetical protein